MVAGTDHLNGDLNRCGREFLNTAGAPAAFGETGQKVTCPLCLDENPCAEWHKAIEKRLGDGRNRFDALPGSRTGTQARRDVAAGVLMQWFLHARNTSAKRAQTRGSLESVQQKGAQ